MHSDLFDIVGPENLLGLFKGAVSLFKVEQAVTKAIEASNGLKITGFTEHGVMRAIERSVSPPAILDALKNPLKINNVVVDQLGRKV